MDHYELAQVSNYSMNTPHNWWSWSYSGRILVCAKSKLMFDVFSDIWLQLSYLTLLAVLPTFLKLKFINSLVNYMHNKKLLDSWYVAGKHGFVCSLFQNNVCILNLIRIYLLIKCLYFLTFHKYIHIGRKSDLQTSI